MKRVLVAGIRSPIAHDLIEAFARAGFEVFGADCFIPRTIKRHLHPANSFIYAPPAIDFERFALDCRRIIELTKPDLIIPLNEEIFYWAKLATQLDLPIFAPPLSQLMMLHSKWRFIEFCNSIGLSTPLTKLFTPDCDFKNKVFKPEYSRFGERTIICPNSRPNFAKNEGKIIVQEFIQGEDVSFYAIAINGAITAFSAYKSDWRANGGAALCFEPIIDKALFEAAQKLCTELKLYGQISCDLRRDLKGDFYFIECNPRGTSGLHNIALNPNFANAFWGCDLIEPKNEPSAIKIAMLLYGFAQAIKSNKLNKFFTDFNVARDVFSRNNFNLLRDSLSYFIGAKAKKMSLSAFLTHDIECNRDLSENEATI